VTVDTDAGAHRFQALRSEALEPRFEQLKPIHLLRDFPLSDAAAGHPLPPGQTYAELIARPPERPTATQSTLVLQPLGELTPSQLEVVARVGEGLRALLGFPVRVEAPLPPEAIPQTAHHPNPRNGRDQTNAAALLSDVLSPRRPRDAFIYFGVTGEDLFAHLDGTFTFGQVRPEQRLGIWSLARYGDPSASPTDFSLCMARAFKSLAREAAGMFGVANCEAYDCVFNSGDALPEVDARPLTPCPICSQKLTWLTGVEPAARDERLLGFFTDPQLGGERTLLTRELALLRAHP
jgi:archaemetzincin